MASNNVNGLSAPSGLVQRRNESVRPPQSALEHFTQLQVFQPPHRVRKTGIICTIGPACRSVAMLKQMLGAGMNIARLNFSHGTHEYHKETLGMLRDASKSMSKDMTIPIELAIALDTKGPEIRTGLLAGDANKDIELTAGAAIRLTTDAKFKEASTKDMVFVDYERIVQKLKPRDRVFIDDGLISLIVNKIGKKRENFTQ